MLQRNVRVYGPMHALRDDSACWNSEGDDGGRHWFRLDFQRSVRPTAVAVQFQAGFVAGRGRVECYHGSDGDGDDGRWVSAIDDEDDEVEWEDAHHMQTVALKHDRLPPCTSLRLILEDGTDFYGRVILYQVRVWGRETETSS